ncbi:hypothetical protein I4U23_005822 [Adineta vaga]|nr:hypothetical protein I4U23_005822 [Adineta vaga]
MNTSITLTIHSLVFLETLLIPSSNLTFFCKIRSGYLISICSLSVALSYVLQAIYRLYRIVFPTSLIHCRHYYFWFLLILLQWLFTLIICLPFLFIKGFIAYIPFEESYCVTTYRSLTASIYGSIVIYIIPLSILITIYVYVVLFIKRLQHGTTIHRQRQNQRDLTVIKRIILTVNGLVFAGLPSMILWMIYLINGNLIEPLIYQITWLSIQLSIVIENLLLIYFTKEIRDFIRPIRIVHPTIN